MRTLTRKQAKAEGYTIDDCAAGGPIGYKGPRFCPEADLVYVLSEREEKLVAALRRISNNRPHADTCWTHAREVLADLNIEGEI